MYIYQVINTLLQSYNQLQNKNILTFLFLAYGKLWSSGSRTSMLEMWSDAGDTFLSGLSRVSLITLYKIVGHEFSEMLGYPKRGGLFLKWKGGGGLNPSTNYGTSLADMVRSQFTLPTATGLSITDTPNIRPCKTFLVRNLSIWDSVLQRRLNCHGAGIETWIQSSRFLLHVVNYLFFTVKISTNHSNSILVHFACWLFHKLQTFVNQWLQNHHINMISTNILSLNVFFSCTVP